MTNNLHYYKVILKNFVLPQNLDISEDKGYAHVKYNN